MGLKNFVEIQNKTLVKTLKQSSKTVFYKRKFKENNVDIGKIKTVEDLHRLPFTAREDLACSNEDFLAVNKDKIATFFSTSGTTGKRIVSYLSYKDLERGIGNRIDGFKSYGLRKGSVVLNSRPHGLSSFFLFDVALMKMGMFVIRCGSGLETPTTFQLKLIDQFKPNILTAFPSYALRLAEEAEKSGMLDKIKFEKIHLSGEQFDKKQIENKFEGAEIFRSYGFNESAALTSPECREHVGYHVISKDLIFEVIDTKTDENISEGKGQLVITFFSEAMPLIRYKIGDIANFIPYYECECGLKTPLIEDIIGRVDKWTKIKGNLVESMAMIEFLKNYHFDDFLIVVRKNEILMDELIIKIRTKKFGVKEQVVRDIKENFNITPIVEFVEEFPMMRKKVYFIDERAVS